MDDGHIKGQLAPHQFVRDAGDTVVAGTVATDNSLRVQVDAIGEDTALAGIQRLVADAQSSTTRAQLLADRAAGWLFWFALVAAVVTVAVWSALGSTDFAIVRAITVLVIACPHALGLAIPSMPPGVPGMDIPNSPPYETLLVQADGSTSVFAKH